MDISPNFASRRIDSSVPVRCSHATNDDGAASPGGTSSDGPHGAIDEHVNSMIHRCCLLSLLCSGTLVHSRRWWGCAYVARLFSLRVGGPGEAAQRYITSPFHHALRKNIDTGVSSLMFGIADSKHL